MPENLNPGRIVIFADHREEESKVTEHLRKHDADLVVKQLDVGDYIASDRVGIERKRTSDFLQSIIDQRIFKQMESLSETYANPVLVIEGNPEQLFLERNIHGNAIRGVLSSIAIDYRIPIIWTTSPKETAAQVFWMAYREQVKEKREIRIRVNSCRRSSSMARQQEYVVAGLPNINSKLSRRLLEHFGSVKKVFNANEKRLMKVDGFGEKKAKDVWCLLNAKYEKDEQ
jgi:ERCC4-type nuclease